MSTRYIKTAEELKKVSLSSENSFRISNKFQIKNSSIFENEILKQLNFTIINNRDETIGCISEYFENKSSCFFVSIITEDKEYEDIRFDSLQNALTCVKKISDYIDSKLFITAFKGRLIRK